MNSQVFLKVLDMIRSRPLIVSEEFTRSLSSITNKYFRIQVPGGKMYVHITSPEIDILDGLMYLSADSFFVIKSRLARATKGKLVLIDIPVVMITELTQSEYSEALDSAVRYQSMASKSITKVDYFHLIHKLNVSTNNLSSSELEQSLVRLAGKCFKFTYMDSDELWLRHSDQPDYKFQDNHILIKCDCIYSDSEHRGTHYAGTYYDVSGLSDSCIFEEVSDSDFRRKLNKLIK